MDEIFRYWAERAGVEIADRLVDSTVERFWLIGEHPNAAYAVESVAAGVKSFPAGKYLIYYARPGRAINVLHVFHGARSQKAAFGAKRKR
jgi:toxin ParE1/3/4